MERAQLKYEETRLKYGKYKADAVSDDTPTNIITHFETTLPLRKIDIDEYERRLKKFASPESGDVLTQVQLLESF